MKQTLPGNAISLVAAAFIAASCCVHDTRKVSLLQIGANLVLALSSVVLGAWSGLVTLLLSSLRMLRILYNTYNRRQMIVFCVLTAAVGLWVNTRGLIGLLPIVATVQLTVQSYLAHDLYSVKRSIARNLLFGAIYCALLLDIVSGVCDLINFILGVAALCRMRRAPAKTDEPSSAQSVEQTEKPPRKGRFFSSSLFAEIFVQFPYQHFAVDAMHHAGFLQRFARRRGASDAEHPLFKEYRRRVHVAFDNLLDRHIFCDLCHR